MTTAAPAGKTQLEAVRLTMLDGEFRTLAQLIADVEPLTGKKATETSVSARLRDLRKSPYNYHIERQSTGDGLYQYRLVKPAEVAEPAQPSGPANPIPAYGTARSNIATPTAGVPNNPIPVSGATSANRFLDELQAGSLSVGK